MENLNQYDTFVQAIEEARSDETFSDIDIGYIKECIDGQLENLLDSESKENYLSKLKKRIEEDEDLDKEYVQNICGDLYNDVIDAIANKLKFTIDKSSVKEDVMAKILYKFFVVHYIENISQFLETVIMENQQTIAKELKDREGISKRRIEGISNSDVSLILNNFSDAVEVVKALDVSFRDFLNYIYKNEKSHGTVAVMLEYEESFMSDTESIVPIILNSLIDETEGFANIYIKTQKAIFKRFVND